MTTSDSTAEAGPLPGAPADAIQAARGYLRGIWWLVILRGILLIVLGVLALLAPLQTVEALVLLLGAYALVDGIFLAATAIGNRKTLTGWGWVLAQGILGILAGALILFLPGVSGLVGIVGTFTVLWFLIVSSAVSGVLEITAALRDKDRIGHYRGWRITGGIISILFAVLLAVVLTLNPVGTALALVWMLGIYALIAGVLLIVDSFVVRGAVRKALAEAT